MKGNRAKAMGDQLVAHFYFLAFTSPSPPQGERAGVRWCRVELLGAPQGEIVKLSFCSRQGLKLGRPLASRRKNLRGAAVITSPAIFFAVAASGFIALFSID